MRGGHHVGQQQLAVSGQPYLGMLHVELTHLLLQGVKVQVLGGGEAAGRDKGERRRGLGLKS